MVYKKKKYIFYTKDQEVFTLFILKEQTSNKNKQKQIRAKIAQKQKQNKTKQSKKTSISTTINHNDYLY